MDPSSQRASDGPERQPRLVAVSGARLGGAGATIPPRFERQLRGAARRRRGAEHPWAAVAKVNGVTEIRNEYGDPAAEEFLRGTANLLRTSLRESDKLAPVGRGEYVLARARAALQDATKRGGSLVVMSTDPP
jgi:GGDEF domain-containing protein